jgi:hypothetical protein
MGIEEIKFDSDGEYFFYAFADELKENGYINNFTHQPEPFKLSDKVEYEWVKKLKTKEVLTVSTLLQPHEYTCDFKIEWNQKAEGLFYKCFEDKCKLDFSFITNKDGISYIEIKPAWDFLQMTRLYIINSKWVFNKYGIYVQKITPTANNKNCLFAKTFTPVKVMFTNKTKKERKFKYPVITLKDFVASCH